MVARGKESSYGHRYGPMNKGFGSLTTYVTWMATMCIRDCVKMQMYGSLAFLKSTMFYISILHLLSLNRALDASPPPQFCFIS
jgi:hypothetical protein